MKTKIRDGGRIVIPAKYREALGLKPGDEVTMEMEEGGIRIMSTRQAITRAQSLLRRYVPKSRKLSEELIQERKEEKYHA